MVCYLQAVKSPEKIIDIALQILILLNIRHITLHILQHCSRSQPEKSTCVYYYSFQ